MTFPETNIIREQLDRLDARLAVRATPDRDQRQADWPEPPPNPMADVPVADVILIDEDNKDVLRNIVDSVNDGQLVEYQGVKNRHNQLPRIGHTLHHAGQVRVSDLVLDLTRHDGRAFTSYKQKGDRLFGLHIDRCDVIGGRVGNDYPFGRMQGPVVVSDSLLTDVSGGAGAYYYDSVISGAFDDALQNSRCAINVDITMARRDDGTPTGIHQDNIEIGGGGDDGRVFHLERVRVRRPLDGQTITSSFRPGSMVLGCDLDRWEMAAGYGLTVADSTIDNLSLRGGLRDIHVKRCQIRQLGAFKLTGADNVVFEDCEIDEVSWHNNSREVAQSVTFVENGRRVG